MKQLVDCTPELKELVAPGDTADLFADAADSQDAGFDPDDISESGHGNEPGLRYPSIRCCTVQALFPLFSASVMSCLLPGCLW